MNNTASEHYMVERLIVDDLVHWAKDYKARGCAAPPSPPPRVSAAHHHRVASPDRLARRGVSCVRIAWRAGGSPGRAPCAAQVPRSLSLRASRGLLQVDGFRFDLMGHIMLRALNRARREIDGLTLEKDGIDGKMVPQRPCLHFPVLRI